MSGTWMFVQPRRVRRGAALAFVFTGVLLTGFASGSWGEEARSDEGGGQGAPISPRTLADAPEVEESLNDAHELVSRSGDRWSAAYSAREYEGLQQALDGDYVGVGIAVKRSRDGDLTVAKVTDDSPAARAGIRRGDRLRTIDGRELAGAPVTEVVARLRGNQRELSTDQAETRGQPGKSGASDKPGTREEGVQQRESANGRPAGSEVVLGLSREGRDWSSDLLRERLRAETVTVRQLSPDTIRIKVASFTKGSGAEVVRAVGQLPPGAGVLLDLRGNPGGLVNEATITAGAFLDGGLVGTYGDPDVQRALCAEPGGDTGTSLVVLVDGGSMSAAELVAGALQDRGRALIVGSRTFGKGSVQMPKEQPDGSVAELTVGQYATPAGRTMDGEGLTPDVRVGPDERVSEKARTVLSGLAGGG